MNLHTKFLSAFPHLVVEQLNDEFLIYDLNTDRAHCLSTDAVDVWRLRLGGATAPAICSELGFSHEVVSETIATLVLGGLLDADAREDEQLGLRRRDAVRTLGGGLAASTLLFSVSAPTASAALSVCDLPYGDFTTPCSASTLAGAGGNPNLCCADGCCCSVALDPVNDPGEVPVCDTPGDCASRGGTCAA